MLDVFIKTIFVIAWGLMLCIGIAAFLPLWAYYGGNYAAVDFVGMILLPIGGVIFTIRTHDPAKPEYPVGNDP